MVRSRARAAGMSASAFVLERALAPAVAESERDNLPLAVRRRAVVDQRRLHDRVARLVLVCEDLLRPLPGTEAARDFPHGRRRTKRRLLMARLCCCTTRMPGLCHCSTIRFAYRPRPKDRVRVIFSYSCWRSMTA